MADQFDPDAFLASMEPEAGASPSPAASNQPASDFNPDAFLAAIDRPAYANGFSAKNPINESPITLEDRAKLSVGNEAGKRKYLQTRFKDVQQASNGDFIVKAEDGLYRRVDPEGLGSGDAWSQTKELMADAVDMVKPAVQIGAQIGAAAGLATATGGASLLAQGATSAAIGAAVEGGMTSLGRLAGTYDATPEEQLKDIGVESLMNFGGTFVAAGVKPTAGYIAEGLKKAGTRLAGIAPESRAILTDTLGAITGSGAKAFETLIDSPDAVTGAMKLAHAGGASSDEAIVRLTSQMTENAATIAKAARPAATELYENMSKEVIENVPEGFKSNILGVTNSMLKEAEKAGLGVVNGAGKFVMRDPEDFVKHLNSIAAETGELSALATDKESLRLVREAASAISHYQNAKELGGKAGANQVLKLRKVLFDTTYRLKEVADDAALAPAQNILSAMKTAGDKSIYEGFELSKEVVSKYSGESTSNLFSNMNAFYHTQMKDLQPLMRAAGQAAKQNSDIPFQTLSNTLVSSSGRNGVQKSAVDNLIDLIGIQGKAGNDVAHAYKALHTNFAASKLVPNLRKSIISQSAAIGATAALAAGNPALAGGMAVATIATSPKVVSTVLANALKGKAMLKTLAPQQLGALVRTPQALQAWSQGVLGTAEVHNQTFNQLMQQGQRMIQGGQ